MKRNIFQALADPTRRFAIVLIAIHAMRLNAIVENLKTTHQAVLKHLNILTECELSKLKGKEIDYFFEIDKIREMG